MSDKQSGGGSPRSSSSGSGGSRGSSGGSSQFRWQQRLGRGGRAGSRDLPRRGPASPVRAVGRRPAAGRRRGGLRQALRVGLRGGRGRPSGVAAPRPPGTSGRVDRRSASGVVGARSRSVAEAGPTSDEQVRAPRSDRAPSVEEWGFTRRFRPAELVEVRELSLLIGSRWQRSGRPRAPGRAGPPPERVPVGRPRVTRSSGASRDSRAGGSPSRSGGDRAPRAAGQRDSRGSRPDSRPAPRDSAVRDPQLPEGVDVSELDRVTLNSLRTLPDGLAEIVALHLAAAARFLADDPERALAHTRAASRRAGRVAIVREAVGVAAYTAGDYGTALTELKAASRISGSSDYLPMIADCERGLGRPERALALASSPEASTLDRSGKVELLIVAAGARRDLGQPEAAVLTLQVPALKSRAQGEWLARLRYAYADALLEVGRVREAREWFVRAAEVDPEGSTDAARAGQRAGRDHLRRARGGAGAG